MITIKCFSSKSRVLFAITNILMIIFSIGTFIAYSIIKGKVGISASKSTGIAFLSIISMFFILNIVKIYLEYSKKIVITKSIVKFVNEAKYLEAKEYLAQQCQKANFYSNYQIILYFLGYVELLLDNLQYAKKYFNQIDLQKINYSNVNLIASTIFLLGMINQYERDTISNSKIIKTITDKKSKIISLSKNKDEIEKIFGIISDLTNNDTANGIVKLKNCKFNKIPFIQRFINSQ